MMEAMKAWGRGRSWMYCLQCTCRVLWGGGMKSRLVWLSHTHWTNSVRQVAEAERRSVPVNVIDRAMVHYTEQPWEAGRGVMVSEASSAAGMSARGVREGKRAFVGTCACPRHGHGKTFTSFWVSHSSAVNWRVMQLIALLRLDD